MLANIDTVSKFIAVTHIRFGLLIAGYGISQIIRKLIKAHFGDKKQHRGGRQVKVKGVRKVEFIFTLGSAVTNLVRMVRLINPPCFA